MKILHFIVGLIFVQATCPRYECKSSKMHFTEGTCVASIEGSYYISSCKTGFCSPAFGSSNSTCIPSISERLLINFPGTSCSSSADCYSNYCYKGICKGQEHGQNCSSTYDCDAGLFCNSSLKCSPLLKAGSLGCSTDFSCSSSSGCNSSKCVEYFSLQPGEIVEACPASNKNLLCSSGTCSKKGSQNICIEKVKNQVEPPFKCQLGTACLSSPDKLSGLQLESECVCGLGSSGDPHCGLFPGDHEMNRMIEKLKDWTSGKLVEKCNSMVRFQEICMKTWLGDEYYEFIYQYWLSQYYSIIADAKDCVLEVYLPDFFEAINKIEDSSSSSSDFSVMLLALSGLFLI